MSQRSAAAFDEVADLYDRARPRYPAELVDELLRLTGIGPASRVLEIGPGTGQLTEPLAAVGSEIVALEVGPSLAELARRRLAAFPRVRVITTSFESWEAPPEPFDAVVSASAFHWLDPSLRVAKSVSLLRDGGSLAIIEGHHIHGGTRSFFERSQECYRRWMPDTPPDFQLPSSADLPRESPELSGAADLEPALLRRYEREYAYSTSEYQDLFRTYSDHRALGPEGCEGLVGCLGRLIDLQFGGRITKRVLTELRVARVRRTHPTE